ncbi:probable TIF5-translation initiation factor eIF5 [Serendipita indica DSM 11827]|uniref:Probable TIF5-translation initiation factor eIF5 n=1 Tax=Serendipita indica (strain DSM 11827) TaxID=1109443 RepID=G4TRG5_SERID|nr:probable TIF5-translation initiation factor eIF5 [Serendipita indica DSM 11827]
MASAGVVNIRRDVDDVFYRYRMPVMLTKVEGRGNGIKTVIPNMTDVAKALSRPPQYTTKFFGCELGAQTILDDKADRWIVNGEHSADRLRELLYVFIEKFVLCAACKNPETELIITKNENIIRDCKACGQQTNVDMRHKLTTFILKNPPKKKSKSRKGTDTSTKEKGEEDQSDGAQSAEDGDALAARIKSEAAELAPVESSAIANDGWSADAEVAAVTKRTGSLNVNDSDEEKGDDPMDQLRLWIEINRDNATSQSVEEKLVELGIKDKHRTVQVVMESLFTSKIITAKELKKFQPLLASLVSPIEEKEKHQKALLGGVERLVGLTYPELTDKVPLILMELYQADLLTEEAAKQWGTHVSKKYVDRDTSKRVRKAAEPFIKWLDEAESDEE